MRCVNDTIGYCITSQNDPKFCGFHLILAEDFETGTIDVAASVFSDTYKIKCKDVWDQPCKKGGKMIVSQDI